MIHIICALSDGVRITPIAVKLTPSPLSGHSSRLFVRLSPAERLILVRICKNGAKNGGMTKDELEEWTNCLKLETYGKNPEDANENLAMYQRVPGVMNSMENVSARLSAPEEKGVYKWAAASLTLVRIFKERMSGGLTKAQLRESKDGLHKATYGEDPGEAEDNISTLHNIPGACLKKGLLFFKVMNSFKAVSTYLTSPLEEKVHHILVLVPQETAPAPSSSIVSAKRWKLEPATFPIPVNLHAYSCTQPVFGLHSHYLSGSGLSPTNLVLHCRKAFHGQFTFLRERVMSNSRFGWIIHLRKSDLPVCLRFAKSQKWSISINAIDLPYSDAVLDDYDGKYVVFLDGFVHSDDAQMSVQKWCNAWRKRAREKRWLVVVCSTTFSGKSNIDDDTLNGVEEFVVDSWRLEEYLTAARDIDE
ncbi:hypothetical protein HDU81_001497, partial [Chytriomyces hyalinus]